MYELELSAVRGWMNRNEWRVPAAIAVNCPYCAIFLAFSPRTWHDDAVTHTISFRSGCPACGKDVDFWTIHPTKEGDDMTDVHLVMHPSPLTRRPIEGYEEGLEAFEENEYIAREYRNLLNCYNKGLWDPTATQCGRLLEAILADKLPASQARRPPYKRIEALAASTDLAKPLIDLSTGLRRGRNLGAHFRGETATDQLTASWMLDLAESLLEYMYLLPQRITALEFRLDDTNADAGEEDRDEE